MNKNERNKRKAKQDMLSLADISLGVIGVDICNWKGQNLFGLLNLNIPRVGFDLYNISFDNWKIATFARLHWPKSNFSSSFSLYKFSYTNCQLGWCWFINMKLWNNYNIKNMILKLNETWQELQILTGLWPKQHFHSGWVNFSIVPARTEWGDSVTGNLPVSLADSSSLPVNQTDILLSSQTGARPWELVNGEQGAHNEGIVSFPLMHNKTKTELSPPIDAPFIARFTVRLTGNMSLTDDFHTRPDCDAAGVTLPLHPLISTDMWYIMVCFIAANNMVQQSSFMEIWPGPPNARERHYFLELIIIMSPLNSVLK